MSEMKDPVIQPEALPVRPTDLHGSLIAAMNGVLLRSDRAWRNNRRYQMMMRQDPEIVHAIMVRENAISTMGWSVSPVDDEDLEHKARCVAVENAIRAIPKFVQLRRHLASAVWYGGASAHIRYSHYTDPIAGSATDPDTDETADASVKVGPVGYTVIHGDSMRYTQDGEPVLLVNMISDRFDHLRSVYTENGKGVILEGDERGSFIVSTWGIDALDPEDSRTAERVYAGHGLRSMVFDAWMRKQHLAALADSYAERLARGLVMVGHDGSMSGKAAAESIANAIGQSTAVTVNLATLTDHGGIDAMIKVFEADGTGNQILRDMQRDVGEQIRLVILTQTLTTGTAATGLGSGVAEAHEATYKSAITYDAEVLDEALTRDLLRPIWLANFPDDPRVPSIVSSIREDEEDIDSLMSAAERMVNMGVTLSERDIRQQAGFREPRGDEPVVGGGGPGGGVDDLMSGLASRGIV